MEGHDSGESGENTTSRENHVIPKKNHPRLGFELGDAGAIDCDCIGTALASAGRLLGERRLQGVGNGDRWDVLFASDHHSPDALCRVPNCLLTP